MPTAVAERGGSKMNRKILSISSKRQITIPQKFYQTLGFGDEAECVMRGNELIIRPVKTIAGGEFAEQILAELIAEGLSGEDLLSKFKKCCLMQKKLLKETVNLQHMTMSLERRINVCCKYDSFLRLQSSLKS